jgi:NCAIR mutase (PurE)-related protein
MTKDAIFELLEKVRAGETPTTEAYERLKNIPFEDLTHTKIDHHRVVRKGLPEVVFGEGKSIGQIGDIIRAMRGKNLDVLVTRLSKEVGKEIAALFPAGTYKQAFGFDTLQVVLFIIIINFGECCFLTRGKRLPLSETLACKTSK